MMKSTKTSSHGSPTPESKSTKRKLEESGDLYLRSPEFAIAAKSRSIGSDDMNLYQGCSKRAVRQAYHNLCHACAKEQNVCAKCRCCVHSIVGRDVAEVEAEQKALEEAIKNARERDRRSLIRAMNKSTPKSSAKNEENNVGDLSAKNPSNEGSKVGDLFPSATLEDYASKSRSRNLNNDCDDDDHNDGDEVEDDNGSGDDEDGDDDENNEKADNKHNSDHGND